MALHDGHDPLARGSKILEAVLGLRFGVEDCVRTETGDDDECVKFAH